MVLESLMNPATAKQRPLKVFFLGFSYALIGLFLSNIVFEEYASLIFVFFTAMAAIPLLYFTIKAEEGFELKGLSKIKIFKEHGKVLTFLMLLFLGMTAALTIAYIFFPASTVSNLFSAQTQTIVSINSQLTGSISKAGTSNTIASGNVFLKILLNNIRVLVFCILFSFLYGMGAIFILTWNASIISTAIGNLIRKNLAIVSSQAGLSKMAAYFNIFSFGFLRYILHGIPEILAYFTGGLAGGIISVAIIKKDLITKNRDRIITDVAHLILLAFALLAIAALLEVYVSPKLF